MGVAGATVGTVTLMLGTGALVDAGEFWRRTPRWQRAKAERRKEMCGLLFDYVKVGSGKVVAVKPKDDILPLVAVATDKDQRSRPDSNRRSRP